MMLKSEEGVFRVEDIIITDDSHYAENSGFLDKQGIIVAPVRKGKRYIFNPSENERLDIGDALIIIGKSKNIRGMKNLVG